jgi:hypothetical protein
VLEPDDRRLLLDLLRPSAGFGLDRAVATTFTLDLHALLTAPLAFAMFDWEGDDVADLNPVASLEAVRRHADRIDLFCQSGEIVAPKGYRHLLSYIEESVHEIRTPPGVIFHPKLWVLRFAAQSGETSYRVLCLTRNLTFDRSWDAAVSLDGAVAPQRQPSSRPLAESVRTLPQRTVWPMAAERADRIAALADELEFVAFDLPEGFDDLRFHALDEGVADWPFSSGYERMLVVSPFLAGGTIARLAKTSDELTIVSRPESLDQIGAGAAPHAETFVLSSDAAPAEDADTPEAASITMEARANELAGLHAKLYVAEKAGTATTWTGSANATDAGFAVNTEFFVALSGPVGTCGVDAILGSDERASTGLLRLLEPYKPQDEPIEPGDDELAQKRLDEMVRVLAGIGFTAVVEAASEPDHFRIRLVSAEPVLQSHLDGIDATVWPITLSKEAAGQKLMAGEVDLDFGTRAFERITPFFFIELIDPVAPKWPRRIVINARLTGAPGDRRERLLVEMLTNASEFLAYLRFLLAEFDEFGGETAGLGGTSEQWGAFGSGGGETLLEPLVRALARDPRKLDSIAALMDDLGKSERGRALIPESFAAIWEPIWSARSQV